MREHSSTAMSINAQEQICNAKALPLCPPLDPSTKAVCLQGKREGEKALSSPFLASGLYLLHCVVKSSWQAVDSCRWGKGESRGDAFPSYCN